MQRTLFGPYRLETDYDVGPAPIHEVAPLAVLLLLVVLLGVAPDIIYERIQDAIEPLLGDDL